MHLLLQSRLGLPGGLGDPGARLLDPAAGAMNFLRAAWRVVIDSGAPLGEPLLSRSLGVELLESVHARGRATLCRFLRAIDCRAAPERLPAVRADALAPPPELLREPFNVVIGNPPWRGRSSNRGRWITDLVQEYFQVDGQGLGERNPKWVNDDYVKFLRLAQWQIERSGSGIVAFVVNHNILDAPTFRGVRQSLLRTFQEVYALDLHGNTRRGENGNVFRGVAQGAAVLFLVKSPGLPRRVLRADLHGGRREKLKILGGSDAGTTPWTEVEARGPAYLLLRGDRAVEREYERGLALPEIFPVHGSGIVTGRDADFIALDRDRLIARWGPGLEGKILPFLARPFDLRFILYAEERLARPRRSLMAHMLGGGIGDNVGLIVPRQWKEEPGALVTRWLTGHKVVSAHDVNSLFPLYLGHGPERRPNLAPGLGSRLGGLYGEEPSPEAILGYVYAVLYSEAYRRRYRELLRRSFPRIVFSPDAQCFAALSALGRELIELHLMRDPPRLSGEAVEPGVWAYRIGGYRVLRQWLRARKGRPLRPAEARHAEWVAEALQHTRAVQRKLDDAATPSARACPWRQRSERRHPSP